MSGCQHKYKWNGDFCQWVRTTDKKSENVIQYISYCEKCNDIKEHPVENIS